MADSFKFELVSPERLLLSEQVTAVVVPGSEGYMTVMAHKAPLMATLKPGIVRATLASGGERAIFIEGGFADINPDGFTLLAERATAVEDLDVGALDREIEELRGTIANAESDEQRYRAEGRLADLTNARTDLGR